MKRKATCFFCYSWDNSNMYGKLSFLKDAIEDQTNEEIEVILDKTNYRYSDDFNEKLKMIQEYDIIVPFFSPEFKSVILDISAGGGRELSKEYERIVARFKEDEKSVFPVILSGSTDTAVPSEFSRKNCPNVSEWGIRKDKNKKFKCSAAGEVLFEKFRNDLIGRTKYNYYNKSVEYKDSFQAIQKLFWLTNTTDLPSDCLVEIDIYPRIISQEYYFVAGRKGTGKSTFINNFRHINKDYFEKHYKQIIPINADDFNHDFLYEELIKKHVADRNLFPPKDMLETFWQLYFILQSILTICIEVADGKVADVERRKIFRKVSVKLKDILSLKRPNGRYKPLRDSGVPKLLFMLAASAIDNHYNVAIANASDESVLASFLGNMDVINILESLFGVELFDQFVQALSKCSKKIIISVDGFDSNSEVFRRSTQKLPKDSYEYKCRQEYEEYFFKTLITVVTKFKNKEYENSTLYVFQEYLDFCIILPKDRYDQIISEDRDSAKKKFGPLVWDAYDLLKLITFRLEYLIQTLDETVEIHKTEDIFKRFSNALDFFPAIPKEITISINGHNQKIGIFNYLLRASFWRPRDVISNFSYILAYVIPRGSDPIIQNNEPLENKLLDLTIKTNARKIIEKELIDEYKNVFRNLDAVLHSFIDSELIVSADIFCSQLSKLRFDASYAYQLDKTGDKLYVLYQLGLIGLYFEKNTAESLGYLHHICFNFNAGLEPIRNFTKYQDYKKAKAKIIFNPILSQRLSLKINTNELLCNWTPEYITTLHKMKSIIHTI